MHCISHNRSYSSTFSWELMTIHNYYLDTKEAFDPMLYLSPSWSRFDIEVYWFLPNNRIFLSLNTAYLIPFINLFSSLWDLVSIRMLVLYIYIYIERERERIITIFRREIENKMWRRSVKIKNIVISQTLNYPSHAI